MKKYLIFISILIVSQTVIGQNNDVFNCLKKNSIEIKSINPDDTDYSDLKFLGRVVKNKNIVILGEASHGDGSSFLAKSRITKFLVEKEGFNAIAFEGGDFYGIKKSYDNILAGSDPIKEFQKSWFWTWTKTQETKNLMKYMGKEIRNRKIEILGLEPQQTNYYSFFYPYHLKKVSDSLAIQIFDKQKWKTLFQNYKTLCLLDTVALNDSILNRLTNEFLFINQKLKKSKINNETICFNEQCINNILAFIEQVRAGSNTFEEQNKGSNIRDKQMFENLKWYISRHPNAKVIVWSASFHAAHNLNQIFYTTQHPEFYNKKIPLGDYIYSEYKGESYNIAFTAQEGYTGYIIGKKYKIDNEKNILEQLLGKLGYPYAFVNFQEIRKNKKCAALKFNSGIFGHVPHKGNWFNVIDGVFFIKKMKITHAIE